LDTDHWNFKYKECVEKVKEKGNRVKGIVLGFVSNIDAVCHVDIGKLQSLFDEKPEIEKKLLEKLRSPPGVIFSIEDFLAGLVNCLEKGIGEEWVIKNKDVFRWLQDKFGYDQIRMGGLAGIAANTLSKLGVNNVIVHAASLPKKQASLFLQNVRVPLKINKDIILKDPMSAVRVEDEEMVHYIFEFDKGMEVTIGKERYVSPIANRFIASWDPKNARLEIDPAFYECTLKIEFDRAVISGYQLLWRKYEDGLSHADKINGTVKLISEWRRGKTRPLIHLEMGSTKDPETSKAVLEMVSPHIDSIGLNEDELADILHIFTFDELSNELRRETTAKAVYKAAEKLLNLFKVNKVFVHTADFSISVLRPKYGIPIQIVQKAMLFGSALASARAVTGGYTNWNELRESINSPRLHLSLKGLEEHLSLADELEKWGLASKEDFLENGLAETENLWIVFIVTKITDDPATTTGLGDCLIAGVTLAEIDN